MEKLFRDAFLQEEPYRSVCYRTGMTVYEESFIGGRFVASGWNGAGYPLSVINLPAPQRLDVNDFTRPQAFHLAVDGQFLGSHWNWAGFAKEETPEGLHVTVTLEHAVRPVRVAVHTLLDGTPVLCRWLAITNTGDRPAAVNDLAPLSGAVQSIRNWEQHLGEKPSPYSVGYFESTNWANEGWFQWHPLPNAAYRIAGRFGRKRHRHPMFVLRNECLGELFVCQLAWSGGYSFELDLDAISGSVDTDSHLSWRIAMDAPGVLRVLSPGETAASPEVHVGMAFGDLDDALQAMHGHVRRSVMAPQARGRGCWIETGIGPEILMTQDMTLQLVEAAAGIGAEVFFIDAGWYTPPDKETEWWQRCGDWKADPARYPQGIGLVRDRVKKHGMLFGLWMDAERLGSMSAAAREHPEWICRTYAGAPNRAGMLNLSIPEAAAWMEGEIARVIQEYGCDFFRLDNNLSDYDSIACNERDGFVEDHSWRYYEALYAVYDRLRARFPQVIFESCAGGGGRTDLGFVRRFSHTWVTDWQIGPRSFSITNGMTMALPPEYVDRLIAGQSGHTTASLLFQLRQLLFVRPTIGSFNPVGTVENPVQKDLVRHAVGLYKDFIRPFLPESRIFHHTPVVESNEPKGWGILELASKDSSRGMLGVFQLASPVQQETVVRLRGASASSRYKVTWDTSGASAVVDGFTLVNEGLRVRLEGALTSELILYEKA
jgi:alpha-galactosidase